MGFELLPEKFTLPMLQRVYETILGRKLDKRNFLFKLKRMTLVVDTGEKVLGVVGVAPALYRFDKAAYQRLTRNGFNFDL